MSLLKPDNLTVAPSGGGFVWEDETKFRIVSNNPNVFLTRVKERLLATGKSVGTGWIDEIFDYVCRHQDIPCSNAEVKERRVTWQDAESFGHMVLRWKESGEGFVPQEEAERRAEICSRCAFNKPLAGICSGCGGLVKFLSGLVAGKGTSKDHLLSQCETCACTLSAAVHVPLAPQRDDRFTADDFARECWKREAYR